MVINVVMKDMRSKMNIWSRVATYSFDRMRTSVCINGRSQTVDIRKETKQIKKKNSISEKLKPFPL